MSVNSHIRNNGDFTRHLAAQSMSFRETAHSGTDPDELSEILSTPNSPIKVSAEGNMPIAFHCNFISVGEVAVADCTYEGTVLVRREAPCDRMIVFLPMEGNACFDGMREQIYSVPARGTILEAGRATGARLFGPRRHFGLFIDQAKIISHLTQMFERTISGDIDFHPHIDLTAGPGLVLQQLVSSLHRGLSGNGPLQRSPLAVGSLFDADLPASGKLPQSLFEPACAPCSGTSPTPCEMGDRLHAGTHRRADFAQRYRDGRQGKRCLLYTSPSPRD